MAPRLSYIGCAGWSLPAAVQNAFGAQGSHLQRYATRLNTCEINSSFYRPHSRATYARWAESVPQDFRFCVKLPKTITHERKLLGCEPLLDDFLAQAGGLGSRLGCLLVQLPPGLAFDPASAADFFHALRQRWPGAISAEPRHSTWFDARAEEFLAGHRIARVLADPVRHEAGALPGGWPGLVYLRLHGSPRMYYSAYGPALIAALARRMALALREGIIVWCIFDNTAAGAAAHNALSLQQALDKELA
ncbi:DUF72 domain-containing protein [Caenimonas soli]|uniref:DUF72 domain-containing protein n=1 Tax=Caenimonas soli TaxID=2735555 RepID=UPI002E2D924A|nr:DUF72 domain-containing protein [Caenimonas soli]